MQKRLVSSIYLTYPPISNQEADWLWNDSDVREHVKDSKLYMLAQREEVFFANCKFDSESCCLCFSLETSGHAAHGLSIDFTSTLSSRDEVLVEVGRKHVRIWSVVDGEKDDVLEWFTVDKLLFDHWRGHTVVSGLGDCSVFTAFRLYYVGISKRDDSFSRLFQNGHVNRTRILSNETQIRDGARLTDEIYVFLFDIRQLHMRTVELEGDIEAIFEDPSVEAERLAADAEKAFVNILDTKYNTVKYERYPEGNDGLYGSGLDSYGYYIDEDIVFQTEVATIRGAHHGADGSNRGADLILISGDDVTLVKP
ncbi:hypothetical protein [Corallococcus exiguus]|uniref:hypothetical protein n=1 Tax=Corallococcus exiguus TaxID=83462 RepID=UPI003DA4547D